MSEPYTPLDETHLAESVANALLARPCEPLPPASPFEGAGIYAIYYSGPFPAYEPISRPECEIPIYVGRAVPKGGRKGGRRAGAAVGPVLFGRLQEHAETIRDVENLELADFRCRYLVTGGIWISLAEDLLIPHFRPLWNGVVSGFGIHDPGGGRYQQKRSEWDTVHPGRSWAMKCQPREEGPEVILERVRAHFEATEPEPGGLIPPAD